MTTTFAPARAGAAYDVAATSLLKARALTAERCPIGRPKVGLLSRDKIVAAALDMVDGIGADKFSIYKLAKQLGVTSQSIYHYFSNREELLIAVGSLVLDEVKGPRQATDAPWEVWLESAAMAYYRGLRLHPKAMSLLIDRRTHPAPPSLFEAALRRMTEAGIAPERGLILVDALSALALSWVGYDNAGTSKDRFNGLNAADFPVLDSARSVRMDERSRFGVAVRGLITGFRHLEDTAPDC